MEPIIMPASKLEADNQVYFYSLLCVYLKSLQPTLYSLLLLVDFVFMHLLTPASSDMIRLNQAKHPVYLDLSLPAI